MLDTKTEQKWPLTTQNCFDGKKQVVKGHFARMHVQAMRYAPGQVNYLSWLCSTPSPGQCPVTMRYGPGWSNYASWLCSTPGRVECAPFLGAFFLLPGNGTRRGDPCGRPAGQSYGFAVTSGESVPGTAGRGAPRSELIWPWSPAAIIP